MRIANLPLVSDRSSSIKTHLSLSTKWAPAHSAMIFGEKNVGQK